MARSRRTRVSSDGNEPAPIGGSTTGHSNVLEADINIVPSARAPVKTAELLTLLGILHDELRDHDQEVPHEQADAIARRASELIHPNLLSHKDKGVRAYVACCLSDMLRITAPDAPYTEAQLKDIMLFFVRQLQGLQDQESSHYALAFYLLESLDMVRSAVLVCDLSGGDVIVTAFFRTFFDVAIHNSTKQVHFLMADVMQQLIEESQIIPTKLLDVLLSQLLLPAAKQSASGQNTAKPKIRISAGHQTAKYFFPAGHQIASQVLFRCADYLQRYVCQYFSGIIMGAASMTSNKNDVHHDQELDISSIVRVHQLVVELWKCAPSTLLNIIPQLETEMMQENAELRAIATETVGILLESPQQSDLSSQFPSPFKKWLARAHDKSALVRTAWISCVANIISVPEQQTSVIAACLDAFEPKLMDPDDLVRTAACEVFSNLTFEVVNVHVPKSILESLSERCKDRRQTVREAAFKAQGSLFAQFYQAQQEGKAVDKDKFSWIPNGLLQALFADNREIDALLERTLYLLVLNIEQNDDHKRTSRLVEVIGSLSDRGRKAFFGIMTRQCHISSLLSSFLNEVAQQGQNKSPALADAMRVTISKLSAQLANPQKAEEDLKKFAEIHDRRICNFIANTYSGTNDFSTIMKSMTEALKRIGSKNASLSGTFEVLLYKSALLVLNKSTASNLVQLLESDDEETSSSATEILSRLSMIQKPVFSSIMPEVLEFVSMRGTKTPDAVLKFIAAYAKESSDSLSGTSLAVMVDIVKRSQDEAAVKHATTILCFNQEQNDLVGNVLKECSEELDYDDSRLTQKLSCFAQCALYAPLLFEPYSDSVISFVINEVLLKVRQNEDEKNARSEEEWSDPDRSTILRSKCLSIICNRLRANANSDTASELGAPFIQMLHNIFEREGALGEGGELASYIASRLRLDAGKCVLKLAKFPAYEKLISPQIVDQLSQFVWDVAIQVRSSFIRKLRALVQTNAISIRYIAITFLCAFEPDEALKTEMNQWLKSMVALHRRGNTYAVEQSLPDLLSILAHNPDYESELEDCEAFLHYVEFFLDITATQNTISLLYHLAQRVKQTADAVYPAKSERLYLLSDLCQMMIEARAKHYGWSLQVYPKNLKLPKNRFAALESTRQAHEIAATNYLPETLADKLRYKVAKLNRNALSDTTNITKKRLPQSHDKAPRKKRASAMTSSESQHNSLPRRRSGRIEHHIVYKEISSDDEDEYEA